MAGENAPMKRSFRVLVLADSRSVHTARYVAELRRQNCRVLVASLEHGSLHHYHLKHRTPIKALHYLLAVFEIRALVRRFRPDVVNPHFASGYGFAAAMAGIKKNAGLLLHLWGSDILLVPHKSWLHRLKTKVALRAADCVIGDSEYLVEQADAIAGIRNKQVIFWGIEKEYTELHKSDYTLGRPLRIIVPRPHEAVYNNSFILKALTPLINDGKISLTFADSGNMVDKFKTEAARLVGDRLHFYPRLSRRKFLELMAEHDVYISAALSDSSPASLIEAMALGLVPVAADIPGVREWLSSSNGFLFDLTERRRLFEIVNDLAGSKDAHETMRLGNLQKVKDHAIFEDNVARTIDLMGRMKETGSQ